MIRVRIKNSLKEQDLDVPGLTDEPTYPRELERLGKGIMETEK